MQITLTCVAFQDYPPTAHQVVTIDEEGGSIGRSDDNDFVVVDPDHFASRHHAKILVEDDCVFIEDTSNNGTLINDSIELFPGQRHQLSDGDTLLIGECTIEIRFAVQTGAEDLDAIVDSIDEAFGLPPAAEAPQREPAAEPIPRAIPEAARRPGAAVEPPPVAADPPGRAGEPLHHAEDPVPRPMRRTEDPAPGPVVEPHERPVPAPVATAPLEVAAAAPAEDAYAADSQAIDVFLEELQIDPASLEQDIVEIMGVAGIVLRTLAQGVMDMLKARTSVKKTFGMDTTKIKGVQNNALKFSMSPEEALARLLNQEQGFLDPIESVQEAVHDAQAHQVAMVSGMNAAIRALLARFDPEQLEKSLNQGFSFSRKAKYWDLYREQFEQIARDSESDFNDLFAEEFRKTYEEQVRKLEGDQ